MKRILFLASIAVFTAVSCFPVSRDDEQQTDQVITDDTVIATFAATDVTGGAAVLNGYVDLEAVGEYTSFGFITSSDPNPTLDNGWARWATSLASVGEDKRFSDRLLDLVPNTTTYYKAFVLTDHILRTGDIKSFTTREKYFAVFREVRVLSGGRIINICVETDFSPWALSHYFENNYKISLYCSSTASTKEALIKEGNEYVSEFSYSVLMNEDFTEQLGWIFYVYPDDLTPETEYYYMPYIKIGSDEYFGETGSFTSSANTNYEE